ncbi:MAG TPA: hypothetical protein VFR10_05980 [bacterium]|nr:hypothetical protein [bacterium]
MRRAKTLLVCSIFLTLFTVNGCEEDDPCSEECFSRFTLYVRPTEPALFAAGTYQLDALVDGEEVSCHFSVNADHTTHFDCEDREILAGTDLIFMTFPGTPAQLDISLWFGSTALLEESITPAYEAQNPGGPDCGPGCEAADAEFFVAP